MARTSQFHVSPNSLEGSLCDVSLDELTTACKKHLISGAIRVRSNDGDGVIELRAGLVERARFGEIHGDAAVRALGRLSDGFYELVQRLPDFEGKLRGSARCEGDLSKVSLNELMRHCEDLSLSCTITVVSGFDRGEIVYTVGEITDVRLNGKSDEDAIVDLMGFEDGRVRIAAPPLPFDIGGWPSVKRAPTAPFVIDRAEETPPAALAARSRAADDGARAKRPTPPPIPKVAARLATSPPVRSATDDDDVRLGDLALAAFLLLAFSATVVLFWFAARGM